jgi:TM2 domain-containing membrane protein YozV
MHKAIVFIFVYVLLCITKLFGQHSQEELKFATYLYQKKNYDEAVFVLKNLLARNTTSGVIDSSTYLLGRIYYNLQQLPSSIFYYDQVSNSSKLKTEAVFFSSFNEAYLGNAENGFKKLEQLNFTEKRMQDLKLFEMAGMSLLQNDYTSFHSLRSKIVDFSYEFAEQNNNLDLYYTSLVNAKRKSPFLGAVMSVVIPGSGKIYAGKTGQGIYNFFITGILGLQTMEAYRKSGPQSFRFIAYSTLFGSFYIGNIWGSALSVKMKKDESIEGIHQQILFDLHIPLRTIFH